MYFFNTSIIFNNHEDFASFFERFGKGSKEFSMEWFGLEKDSTFVSYDDNDTREAIVDEEKNRIRFMSRNGGLEDLRKIAGEGVDFKYSLCSEDGEGESGFFKDGRQFLTIKRPENSWFDTEVKVLPNKKLDWRDIMYDLTKQNAKVNSIVQKVSYKDESHFELIAAIISEYSTSSITLSRIEDKDEKFVPCEEVIAEYKNIEGLTADGWALDLEEAGLAGKLPDKTQEEYENENKILYGEWEKSTTPR